MTQTHDVAAQSSSLLKIKHAVALVIVDLGFEFPAPTPIPIHVLTLPSERVPDGASFPMVQVTTWPTIDEEGEARDNPTPPPDSYQSASYDVAYPVQVSILAQENQIQDANEDTFMLWREAMIQTFRDQRRSTGGPLAAKAVTEVYKIEVVPKPVIDANAFFGKNMYSSSIGLKCWAQEFLA